MATGPGFPQASNVFIPNWEASGRLSVGFCRNPAAFSLNQYVQMQKAKKIKGYYLKFTNQEQVRVVDQNRYKWPYGKPAPVPGDPESFNFLPYTIQRQAYPYGLDTKTISQADFNVQEVERKSKMTKAMTARTMRSISTITTTSNWQTAADPDLAADHTSTATALVGGKLTTGTSANPVILNASNAMLAQVTLDTNAAIDYDPDVFRWVMNPNTAKALAATPEFKDYLKSSPDAYAQVTGKLYPNKRWGLPGTLYGLDICIEAATKITSERGATLARSFCWPDGTIALLARQGALEGAYGEANFSTFVILYGGEDGSDGAGSTQAPKGIDLIVEEFTDANNKMWLGRVFEETAEILACPASGYLLTSCI